jgi:hypothetical protein
MTRLIRISALAVLLAGCDQGRQAAEPFTLYRNSYVDYTMRVHWGTFDATESDRNYNRNNCEMAARLLNANMDALARAEGKSRDRSAGFWCEPGSYSKEGAVPTSFSAAFPTDA